MATREKKPLVPWDDLYASTSFRELQRYRGPGGVLLVRLHASEDGEIATIWIQSGKD
jgi:hypothetical protein